MNKRISLCAVACVAYIATVLVCLPTKAQDAPKPAALTYTITLTAEQIESLSVLGAQCLDKVPYACARALLFWQEQLTSSVKAKEVK